MHAPSKRQFSRVKCHIPIECAVKGADSYVTSTLLNSSKTGMYFETEGTFKTKTSLQIVMPTYSSSAFGPEAFKFYQTEAVWSQQVSGNPVPLYGYGVKLLKCSKKDDGAHAQKISYPCDMCHNSICCQVIRKAQNSSYLCPDCFKQLDAVPEGNLKESMKRFILGNVI